MFESFVDHYCLSVFSVVAKLTGLPNEKEAVRITADVLLDLWGQRQGFSMEKPTGVIVYRVILRHIFSYFKAQGNEQRILLLKNTLLIDPIHYLPASGS